ncbi:RNA polymerase sigma factor [Streptomyces sp. NPDC059524]|uniref:RNA polymerase sigma factor n=1 Tax=Streptomyces sp. NPDC059524 TaxID=3346856 RepID=UPI0036B08CCB
MGRRKRVQWSADDLALSTAVERAQDGDEAAFSALYRAVQPGLDGYLRGLVGEGADQVAAAVWREIARDLARFRGDGNGFRGWTANIARRHVRRHRRQRGVPSRPAKGLTDRSALAPVDAAADGAWISCLPNAQAEVILLRHAVRLDERAAARVLGRPKLVVRVLERRGLKSLAGFLDTRDATLTAATRRLGEQG